MNANLPLLPTYAELAASDAVAHVRHAGRRLLEAQFRADEAGYACDALDDLAAGTSALVAEWAGRLRTNPDDLEWISLAAVEWRAELDRRALR